VAVGFGVVALDVVVPGVAVVVDDPAFPVDWLVEPQPAKNRAAAPSTARP
jgi:hypothetical protein